MAIEQTYGMLKLRFPALKHGLRFREISKSANCVIAAVVLHNFSVKSMNFFDQNNQQIEENFENLETEEPATMPPKLAKSATRSTTLFETFCMKRVKEVGNVVTEYTGKTLSKMQIDSNICNLSGTS